MTKEKVTEGSVRETFSYGFAFVMPQHSVETIIGRVLTLVDTLGLNEKQDNAIKGLIKQAVRSAFEDGIFIDPVRNDKIHEDYHKMIEESNLSKVPAKAI